jgi:hypothetical protein
MKASKILLPLLLILTFNTTVQAERFKFEVCIQAENSFWKTLDNVSSNTDRSLYEVLDKKDKRNYLMIVSAKIEQSMGDVKSRCKNMSPDVLAAYNKKIRELQEQVNTLN